MEAYTGFAEVYDTFMDNVPYEEWSQYLIEILKEYGVRNGLVADLGCGTGAITERLAKHGYDMIGIDNSEEMLSIAREKLSDYEESDHRRGILYLLQDMREMELYGTVDAVVSICDSMNYITEEEDLLQVFRLVNNYLALLPALCLLSKSSWIISIEGLSISVQKTLQSLQCSPLSLILVFIIIIMCIY